MSLFDPDAVETIPTGSAAPTRPSEVPSSTGTAGSLLDEFRNAGVLGSSDVHVAATLARLASVEDERVTLAAALAARAPRHGHVAVDLATIAERALVDTDELDMVDQLPWPQAETWLQAVGTSPLVAVLPEPGDLPDDATRPLVLSGSLLYLQRYWAYEAVVAERLTDRVVGRGSSTDQPRADHTSDHMPGVDGGTPIAETLLTGDGSSEQIAAVAAARRQHLTVLVGGPGTGKTTTVAALLAELLDAGSTGAETTGAAPTGAAPSAPSARVALAAPTGKAAARLGEAFRAAAARLPAHLASQLAEVEATTIHRLLGTRRGARTSFVHDRRRPLPHDVVVVDESSMISLPLMARLLDAVRPDARLVVVGDPDQLASVEAGTVLADVVTSTGPVADSVVELRTSRRFPSGSPVDRLARAIRSGDSTAALEVLADAGSSEADAGAVSWVPEAADTDVASGRIRALVMPSAEAMASAAASGDSAAALDSLEQVRVLCAHRFGPIGVNRWNRRIEDWLHDAGHRTTGWYPGRPVMATANDYVLGLFNGDVGVVVTEGGRPVVVYPSVGDVRRFAPSRLDAVETVHAMTVHKSQGSEFDHVVVVLPSSDSRLATRELLYTAITRSRRHVTIVGAAEVVAASIERRVVRSSGLRDVLSAPPPERVDRDGN